MGELHAEKQWMYNECGNDQSVQVDVAMGFGFIQAKGLSVLIDYNMVSGGHGAESNYG